MASNTAEQLLEFIQSEVSVPVSANTPIDDLGLDSLELLNLQIELGNRCGKQIPDEMQSKLLTVGDLVNFCS